MYSIGRPYASDKRLTGGRGLRDCWPCGEFREGKAKDKHLQREKEWCQRLELRYDVPMLLPGNASTPPGRQSHEQRTESHDSLVHGKAAEVNVFRKGDLLYGFDCDLGTHDTVLAGKSRDQPFE